MLKVFIEQINYSQKISIRILDLYENSNKITFLKINDQGKLEWTQAELEEEIPPTFELSNMMLHGDRNFLQAFADGLGEVGYYPQATNRDKIKAEAVSAEKDKQIDWMKELISSHWNKEESHKEK